MVQDPASRPAARELQRHEFVSTSHSHAAKALQPLIERSRALAAAMAADNEGSLKLPPGVRYIHMLLAFLYVKPEMGLFDIPSRRGGNGYVSTSWLVWRHASDRLHYTGSVHPGNMTGHFSWREPAGIPATGTIVAATPDRKGAAAAASAQKTSPSPAAVPLSKSGVQRGAIFGNGSSAAHAVLFLTICSSYRLHYVLWSSLNPSVLRHADIA